MIYRNRLHFAAILRRARAERTLTSYDKHGAHRSATVNWKWHLYEGPSMPVDERDEAYERAAARYDGSGRDWR